MYTSLDSVQFWYTPSIFIFTFQECVVYPLNHTMQSINTIMTKHVVLSEIDGNIKKTIIIFLYCYSMLTVYTKYNDMII